MEFEVKLKFKRAKIVKRRLFDYGKGNFDELHNFLTRNPIIINTTDSIDDDWKQWKDTFLTAVRRYIPMRTVKDTNSPPWIDNEVRRLIRKKYKALNQYRINRSAARKRKLRSVTQQIKYLIRSKHQGYLAKIESSLCDNHKMFWSYHKSILHHRTVQGDVKSQHGFLRRKSCVTQLLSVLHIIGQSSDKNIQTDVIYLDFAKPFDSVDHQILLHKLASYGVTGQLYNWFVNYLSGRSQRVVVNKATSSWAPVISGVLQGSLLGPILFVIFINDLPDILPDETLAALYADDTKLYKSITSIGDCENLQQALTKLDQWYRENNLDFNDSKCKVLTITRRKLPLTYAYHMNSKELSRVHKEKDLGVYINDNLSWYNHMLMHLSRCYFDYVCVCI